jgi:hypothetical protein
MEIVRDNIALSKLQEMSKKMHRNIVKAVVDIKQEIMAVDVDLHVDAEAALLENESEQDNLWGINFHPSEFGKDGFVEFDSMINIRPSVGNRTRGVENVQIREKIKKIVAKLVKNG